MQIGFWRASLTAVALTAFLSTKETNAASFDCNDAEQPDQFAICADPDLSARDEVVNEAYQQAKRVAGKLPVNAETRRLLAAREQCQDDRDCIIQNQDEALAFYRGLGATVSFGEAESVTPSVIRIDLDQPLQGEDLRIDDEDFSLEVCNDVKADVDLAISTRVRLPSKDFTVLGWYRIKKSSCAQIGKFLMGDFFYTAKTPKGLYWGGKARFCVSDTVFNYKLSEVDKCLAGYTMPFEHLFITDKRYRITLAK